MNSNWQNLKTLTSENLWLEFLETEHKEAEAVTHLQSNQTARHYAYINHLCLKVFFRWLKENWELESADVFPNAKELASIWEVVNGTAINIGQTRLVLIPHDTVDTEEFSVPQEWVDIPNFAANYYLAAQIDLAQNWMRIWGYTTHKTLKEKGSYDPIYRTYTIKGDELIADIDIILVAKEICGAETANIPTLPALSEETAASILAQISQPSPYSPRLDLPFAQWGALLGNDRWRQQLYIKRTATAPRKMLVNLNHWLTNNFTESIKLGWRSVTEFLAPEPELATVRNYPQSHSVQQAKLLNLQLQLKQQAVVLLVALTPEADGRVGVSIQAHPYGNEKQLPTFLTLALLSDSFQQLHTVISRERDSYIMLPYFHCKKGTNFYIKIAIADVSLMEEFVIGQ
ncbi:hypothetical protein NIES2100_29010 [Calothrix sp. NIES-2100]|uniref:DUF1822 family protein n=1 Tax=Calothrix sp. NIES-2100 TaxID=1954172 RepID=UPI000B601314|nr:hypothetical protein NIES2100_29010 [Calothrix sp. NIES-2100]